MKNVLILALVMLLTSQVFGQLRLEFTSGYNSTFGRRESKKISHLRNGIEIGINRFYAFKGERLELGVRVCFVQMLGESFKSDLFEQKVSGSIFMKYNFPGLKFNSTRFGIKFGVVIPEWQKFHPKYQFNPSFEGDKSPRTDWSVPANTEFGIFGVKELKNQSEIQIHLYGRRQNLEYTTCIVMNLGLCYRFKKGKEHLND